MEQSYEAIIFDFDGVLVDSEPIHYQCWSDILAPHGVSLDWATYCEHCIGISDRAMIAMLCQRATPPLEFETLWPSYGRKKELFRERMLGGEAITPDVRSLIEDLRPSFKLAVVTSSGRREVEPILESAGILSYLGAVVYGDDVRKHKPAPDPYLLAIKRLGVTRALVIEDSSAGIASARSAGLDVIELRHQCDLVRELRAQIKS